MHHLHRLLPAAVFTACSGGSGPPPAGPSFGPTVELTAPDDVSFGGALAAADHDGDGEVDLAVSTRAGTAWFRGPISEPRTAADADAWMQGEAVVSGDIDEDGIPEVFTAVPNQHPTIHAHRGGEELSVATVMASNMGVPRIAVADVLDAPGPELIVGAGGFDGFGPDTGSRMVVFGADGWTGPRSDGEAEAVLWAATSAEWFHALDTGDVTGDGRPELLFSFVGFNHSHDSYLLEPPLAPTDDLEGSASVVFGQARLHLIGDVDGDGRADIAGPSLDGVQFWTGGDLDPNAPTSRVNAMSEPIQSEVHPAGDLDADGFADVVIVDRTGLEAMLFLGPVEGSATPAAWLSQPELGVASFQLAVPVPDVDGDGSDEVLLGQAMDGRGDATGVVWLLGL